MAILVEMFCVRCQKPRRMMIGSGDPRPQVCDECTAKEADAARAKHLADLAARPLEERVAAIEAWIYDFEREWGGTLRQSRLQNMRF